jgi:hypothetical protein
MNGALSFPLVHERVTEESDDAIAHAPEHVTFVAGYACRAGILVCAEDLLQDLRIDSIGQLGGVPTETVYRPHHSNAY